MGLLQGLQIPDTFHPNIRAFPSLMPDTFPPNPRVNIQTNDVVAIAFFVRVRF